MAICVFRPPKRVEPKIPNRYTRQTFENCFSKWIDRKPVFEPKIVKKIDFWGYRKPRKP